MPGRPSRRSRAEGVYSRDMGRGNSREGGGLLDAVLLREARVHDPDHDLHVPAAAPVTAPVTRLKLVTRPKPVTRLQQGAR